MSEISNTLRQQARVLRVLADDVARMPSGWERTIGATRFLGDGIPVEAWFLAEHFLTTQADWRLVRSRYDRYFGASGDHWPRWWTDLDRRCQQMAAKLMEDKELQHLIAASWRREAPSADGHARLAPIQRELADDVTDEQLADDEAAEADSLARQTMTSHERLLLAAMLDGQRESVAAPMATVAWEQSRRVRAAFDRASPQARAEVVWQARNYRHAILELSWLRQQSEQDHGPPTALEHVLAGDEQTAQWAEALVEPIAHALGREEDGAVLRRIVRAVSEVGYEHFFDDAVSAEMAGGADSPLGAMEVQVVPPARQGREESSSEHREARGVQGGRGSRMVDSAQIVVALSRRGRRGASLASVLTKLVERLSRPPAARTVIVVSESWDAGTFGTIARRHFAEHHARGVEFVFLLVGSPEQIVSPVPVILNGLATRSGERPRYGWMESK